LRPKAHMISIAHQYLFLHPDFRFPKENKLSLFFLRFFTRMTAIGATKVLALSFRKMRELPNERIVVVPPLLRNEVLDIKPQKGDYLHGYLLNSGFSEEVKCWHTANPQVALHFFWDKKRAAKIEKLDDTLSFHQLDDCSFLQYMAGAKAYATTAGFESVCEAMYLGKPVLMIPTHIEQACNAYDAMQSGAGAVSARFDLDELLDLSEIPVDNASFRYWVKQAEWLFLREFRKDLLEEDLPLNLLHRLFINWLARLAKSISI
ncbi:MAG: glycosyltransferase family protein, partial [Massilibacteroides sp.]|nr:glycosyltransferase family protein [Massilibacteroides sp.]